MPDQNNEIWTCAAIYRLCSGRKQTQRPAIPRKGRLFSGQLRLSFHHHPDNPVKDTLRIGRVTDPRARSQAKEKIMSNDPKTEQPAQIATGVEFQPLPGGTFQIAFLDDDGVTMNQQVVDATIVSRLPALAMATLIAVGSGCDPAIAFLDACGNTPLVFCDPPYADVPRNTTPEQ